MSRLHVRLSSFFFNAPPPTATYPLSLHDALPISHGSLSLKGVTSSASSWYRRCCIGSSIIPTQRAPTSLLFSSSHTAPRRRRDRKSTRLNSSHRCISYAVFCLKKKKQKKQTNVST